MSDATKANTTEQGHWHLDKTVNLSHIFGTITIAASVVIWANTIEKRVDRNAQSIEFLMQQQREEKNKVETLRSEIRQDFTRVHEKLDRLIEAGNK